MDIYLDEHGEEHGIMAPCGCMLTQPWMAQGRETDATTKEEEGLGGRGGAPMGRGQYPRRGGWSRGAKESHGGGLFGLKNPDWDSPAEGIRAGKEKDEKNPEEEQVLDKD